MNCQHCGNYISLPPPPPPPPDKPTPEYSPEYQDFLSGGTITFYVGPKRKTIEIHKNLLASISPELDKHVDNDMKGGKIHLPDEGEEVLTLFSEWAYTGDYAHKSITLRNPVDPKDPWTILHKHLQLWVFSNKFNVPILQRLAESKFHTEIKSIDPKNERDATGLVMVIGYAYDNLPTSHPILKFLAQYASWKLGLLRAAAGFNELIITQPIFLKEFLMHLNGLTAMPQIP